MGNSIRLSEHVLRRDEGSAGVKYAFILALLVAAAMLYVPGLGARMYGTFADLTGVRLAHFFE